MVVGEGEHEHSCGLQQGGHVLDPAGDPPGPSDDVGNGGAASADEVGVDLGKGPGVGELAKVEQQLQEEVCPVRLSDGLFADPHRGAGVAAEVGSLQRDRLVLGGQQVSADVECAGVLLQRLADELDSSGFNLGDVGRRPADHVGEVLNEQPAGLPDHPRHRGNADHLAGGDRGHRGHLRHGGEQGVHGHGDHPSGWRGQWSRLPINPTDKRVYW